MLDEGERMMEGLCAAVAYGEYIDDGSQCAGGDLGRINKESLFLYCISLGSFLLALLRRVSC